MAMARSLREIIMKHEIRGVVAEIPHGGSKSARASHKMGIALGVVAAVVEMMGLPAEYVQPGDVKLAVCGSRSASKLDVIRKAKSMFGSTLRFPSAARNAEHVADACGAYVACKDTALVRLLSQKEKTRNAAVL
jgi:Holliday junction resolvasome RuvABC endonuclease subunit